MFRVRWSRAGAGVAASILAGIVVALFPAAAAVAAPNDGLPDGFVMTPTGPLSPADRDLIVKVRLAGLWEQPAGSQAQQRGVSPKVREAGQKIAAEHHELDGLTITLAASLGVPLPNQPNADQQGWLNEMAAAKGEDFDRIFVDRLRAAHGKVFSTIADVRAGTQNSAVREFAAAGNAYVLRHMGYLESTGLVNYAELPIPDVPPAGRQLGVTGLTPGRPGLNPTVIWGVLIAAGVAAAATATRVVRAR